MDIARKVRDMAAAGGWTEIRHVFPSWSIEVPPSFQEAFIEEDAYWHAWDETRSVSMSSMLICDEGGRPVDAREIEAKMRSQLPGDPVAVAPKDLLAWATSSTAIKPARASRMLQGMIAAHGKVLIVTITSDDLSWAETVWLSIRHHEASRLSH